MKSKLFLSILFLVLAVALSNCAPIPDGYPQEEIRIDNSSEQMSTSVEEKKLWR